MTGVLWGEEALPVLELSQDLVDEYAWQMLVEKVASAISAYDEPVRLSTIVETVRSYGIAVGPGLVKTVLDNPELPEHYACKPDGRRYDLAWRATGGSLDRAIRAYLTMHGRAPHVDEVVRQVALALQQGERQTRDTVVRMLETRDAYFMCDRRVGLRSWLLDTSAETDEEVVLDNFFDAEEDATCVIDVADQIRGATATETALKAMGVLGPPITLKMAQLAWWKASEGNFDAYRSFLELVDSEELYVASDHAVFPREAEAAFREAIAAAAAEADDDVGEELDAEAVLEDVSIGEEEVRLAVEAVMRKPSSVSVEALAEEVLEISPDEPGFRLVAAKFDERLRDQGEIAMCGQGRWIAPRNRPEGMYNEVPEPLLVTIVRVLTPQGEDVDADLEDTGLDGDLARQVRDPYREDVCDEDEVRLDPRNVARPDEVTWVVPLHHYHAGTLKIRRIDGSFYGGLAGLAECIFHYEQGESFPVWANFALGIAFGMKPFYQRYCPPSGSVLRLRPADASGEFVLQFDGETDPECFLELDRLEQLHALRDEAASKEMSVHDIVCQVMEGHPAGATFQRIATEVNAVRRTRRRTIASVLSLYHCFHLRGKTKDLWLYDARKAEQGRRKAKRKFIRRS